MKNMSERVLYIYKKPKRNIIKKRAKINNKNYLYYIINVTKRKRGVLISIFDSDKKFIKIGYSLCNKKDMFNKKEGLRIARERLNKVYSLENVPNSIRDEFVSFVLTEKKYWSAKYKGAGLWNIKI